MPAGSKPGERRGGRQKGSLNKATKDIAEAAKKYTTKSLKLLGDIVDDENATNSDRLRAAALLLDRGYGKPSQVLNHRGEGLKAMVPIINFGLVEDQTRDRPPPDPGTFQLVSTVRNG